MIFSKCINNCLYRDIHCFFFYKIKSAATGVTAPKNANSNCRQTKPTLRINTICKSAEQAFLPDFI